MYSKDAIKAITRAAIIPMYLGRIVLTIKLQLSREYNSAVVFFGKGKPEYVVVSFHDVLLCTLAFPLIFNLRDNVF